MSRLKYYLETNKLKENQPEILLNEIESKIKDFNKKISKLIIKVENSNNPELKTILKELVKLQQNGINLTSGLDLQNLKKFNI